MTLRPRMWDKVSFYTPDTGSRWVHKNCDPQFWTTYNVIAETEKNNKLMNEDMNYISLGLGMEPDPSLSVWDFITKAYGALGHPPLGNVMLYQHMDYIKTVIAGKDILHGSWNGWTMC